MCKGSLRSAAYYETLRDFWTLRELITTITTTTTRVAFGTRLPGPKITHLLYNTHTNLYSLKKMVTAEKKQTTLYASV